MSDFKPLAPVEDPFAATPVKFVPLAPGEDPFAAAKYGGAEGAAPETFTPDNSAIKPGSVHLRKGATDEEIAKAFNYNLAELKQSPLWRDGMLASLIDEKTEPASPKAERLATLPGGLAAEAVDSAEGIVQAGERVVNYGAGGHYDATVKLHQLHRLVRKSNRLNNIEGGRRVDEEGNQKLALEDLGGLVVPSPVPEIKLIGKLGSTLVKGAVGGATSTQDVTSPDVGGSEDTYGKTAAERGAVSTVVGPTVAKIARAGTAGVAKTVNFFRDIPEVNAPTALVKAARENSVKVRLGDLYRDKWGLRGLENYITPPKNVIATRETARAAAQDKAGDLKQEMINTPFPKAPGLVKAAGDVNAPRHKEAKALLEKLRNPSDDWSDVVDVSGRLEIFNAKVKSDKLYANVKNAATGITNVPTTNFQLVAEALAAKRKATEVAGQDNDYLRVLNNIAKGANAPRTAPTTFTDAIEQRKNLNKIFAKLETKDGAPDDIDDDLKALRQAMTDDMATAARAARKPSVMKMLATADTEYQNTVAVKETALAKALEKNPELADELIPAHMGRDRATLFANALGERGKAAVRYNIVDTAAKFAVNDVGEFEAPVFAAMMRKREAMLGVFLGNTDKHKIIGFTKFMANLDRTGEGGAVVSGERAARFGIGSVGQAVGSSGAGLAGVRAMTAQILGTTPLHLLLNSSTMQKYWLAASDLKPGSVAWERNAVLLTGAINRFAAAEAGKQMAPAEPAETE